jgi:hypothetical protein
MPPYHTHTHTHTHTHLHTHTHTPTHTHTHTLRRHTTQNVTSDCYLQCYNTATQQMTHEQLIAPWAKSFASTDPTQGGCPDAPKYLL